MARFITPFFLIALVATCDVAARQNDRDKSGSGRMIYAPPPTDKPSPEPHGTQSRKLDIDIQQLFREIEDLFNRLDVIDKKIENLVSNFGTIAQCGTVDIIEDKINQIKSRAPRLDANAQKRLETLEGAKQSYLKKLSSAGISCLRHEGK